MRLTIILNKAYPYGIGRGTFMYVCLCNGYRETELRELAGQGYACAVEAYRALGNGPCCGRCLEFAQKILDGTDGALAPQTLAAGSLARG